MQKCLLNRLRSVTTKKFGHDMKRLKVIVFSALYSHFEFKHKTMGRVLEALPFKVQLYYLRPLWLHFGGVTENV